MNKIAVIITLMMFLPLTVWASCKPPKIEQSPFPALFWETGDAKFIGDTWSIGFNSSYKKLTFYAYDRGKSIIRDQDFETEFSSSVYGMLNYYKVYQPTSKHSKPRLILDKLFADYSGRFVTYSGKLIKNAVFILVDKPDIDEIAILSLGSDGKCFFKLRYTVKLSRSSNIEQYFEYPMENKEVLPRMFGFVDLTMLLQSYLLKSGYL